MGRLPALVAQNEKFRAFPFTNRANKSSPSIAKRSIFYSVPGAVPVMAPAPLSEHTNYNGFAPCAIPA
ncbi:hypothetical protein CSC3H3_12505 [Thalassospira marina]|uniref:Uncharacterized protein n=1 Tax=Thalassospira marina TaxID=2048283 RepID=A0ABM6QA62_9PROT|nr:hypothetical protein CSC3H3_12505 [Thalassospira marina]